VAAYMKFGTITGDATQKVGGRILIKDPAFLEEQGWISILSLNGSSTENNDAERSARQYP
jgi:hypothetical protein